MLTTGKKCCLSNFNSINKKMFSNKCYRLSNKLSKVSREIYHNNIKNFCLYIPQRKLSLIKHSKHGRVFPVYIADIKALNQSNPKRLLPIIAGVSGLNVYLILMGLKEVPMMKLYSFIVYSEPMLLISFVINVMFLRKYFNVLEDHKKRVKNMYLRTNGVNLIIESFSGEVHKLECNDIYERRLEWKYKSNSTKLLTNNNNSFRATIKWGNDKESIFEGRRRFMDSEILFQILNRNTIDTSQTQFKLNNSYLNFWTDEEKKKVIKYFRKRVFLRKINFNKIFLFYYNYLNKIGMKRKSYKLFKNNKQIKIKPILAKT